MFSRISSSTQLSHPGRALAGRLRHTSQTDEANAARPKLRTPPRISVSIGHVALNRETCAYYRGGQSFPCRWAFTRENDHHPTAIGEGAVASLESLEHAVFVNPLRYRLVAAEAAGVVYQLAVLLFAVPLRSERVAESPIDFRREPLKCAP